MYVKLESAVGPVMQEYAEALERTVHAYEKLQKLDVMVAPWLRLTNDHKNDSGYSARLEIRPR